MEQHCVNELNTYVNLWQEEVVQRLFQEEPEHEGNEQMEDCGEEVTPGQSLHPRQSVRHKAFWLLCNDCE